MAERTMVRVDGLRAHGRNYNRHGAGQVGDLARSLERFGQRKPITTWRGQIITGHGVVEAARRLGWSEVWAEACPDEWTEAEALAWLAADNELARAADPDEAQLAALVAELGDIDAELARLAAGGEERLKELLASAGSASGEDPGAQIDRAEELRVKWGVETGQLWSVGRHVLMCGNSRDMSDVEKLLGDAMIDGICTDPPYELSGAAVVECLSNVGNVAIVLTGDKQAFDLAHFWKFRLDFIWRHRRPRSFPTLNQPVLYHHHCIVITRTDSVKSGWKRPTPDFGSVIEVEIEFEDTEMGHGKGKEVFEKMMAGFGWRVVADPFVGTGAVLLACELAGRRLLGMEMNPATLAVCLERCQVFGLDVRRADQ